MIDIYIKSNLPVDFPKFQILGAILENFHEPASNTFIDEQINRIYDILTSKYDTSTLKENPIVQAYRQFYWRYAKVDPTKVRPAGEALMRRLIKRKNLPRILPIVDAYNLASAETAIPMCTYDFSSVMGQLEVRLAKEGENFLGIGMKAPQILSSEIPVIADEKGSVSIYPYRDSDRTKVTKTSTKVIITADGVPGISTDELQHALDLALKLIMDYCGGKVVGNVIFK
ncbi:MAG: B3/4 domain-containing protein [Candidatus Hodarchaeota archaeon]